MHSKCFPNDVKHFFSYVCICEKKTLLWGTLSACHLDADAVYLSLQDIRWKSNFLDKESEI